MNEWNKKLSNELNGQFIKDKKKNVKKKRRRYFLVRTWSSIVKRRNATSVVPFAWYDHEKSQWLSTLPLWRHWKFIPRISPISARDNGLLTPPHKQTHIHAVQRRHNTATYQYREGSTLWADSVRALKPRVSPPKRARDMITVCLLLFRALILNSTRTSRRLNLRPIKKTRWKKSR
jgi:hypothetical protein